MITNLVLFLLGFIGIWIGAGLVISSVEKFSHKLKLSSFSVSFLILGLFTSLGEISIGVNSVLNNDPEIYVGNLIGGSIVLFLLIIPLLSITGKQVKINPEFQNLNLVISLIVIGLPALLSLDGKIDQTDSLLSLALFTLSAVMIESKRGLLQDPSSLVHHNHIKIGPEVLKIAFGIILIYLSSNEVVGQTLHFSGILKISPFVISLLVISVGTNLPELSLVVRSLFFKDKEVAFGDYVGSASYNTLIFGALSLWYGKTVVLSNSYLGSIIIFFVGLVLFFLFARSKNTLTRKEGLWLFGLYFVFLSWEIIFNLPH